MKRTITTSLFAALSFVLLTGFYGGCGNRSPEKRAERAKKMAVSHVDDLLDDVDATDAQKKRIIGHTKTITTKALVLHEAHQGTKKFMYEQWQSDRPDSARIHAEIDTRTDAVRAFLHELADALIDTHQTLTPEQRKEIEDELH